MKITKRQLKRIIKEEYARIIKEASADSKDSKVQTVADIVQAELNAGNGDMSTLADALQASGHPAEYMSGMGMEYVRIPHKSGHIVIRSLLSRNMFILSSRTKPLLGRYAVEYMGES